jgi:hypothetical protein
VPPPARYHPVGNLNDLPLGMELLPVTGINHHVSPGTGHPPQPRQRLNHGVAAGGVHQRVPDTKHNVKPFASGRGKIRPPIVQERDRQPLPPKPGGRTPDHRLASVGRPHGEAPAREHRRVDARTAGRVKHHACAADPPQQACRRGQVYRPPVSKLAVVEHPVVVGGEQLIGASHKTAVCQTPPEHLTCTHRERNPTGLPPTPNGGARVRPAARGQAWALLTAKIQRLKDAGLLDHRPVAEAAVEFNAMLEGLANAELRGRALSLLPEGAEEDAWRNALTTVIRGLSAGAPG